MAKLRDGWISVKERLPTEGEEVLFFRVMSGHNLYRLGFRESDGIFESWTPDELEDFTHWRPLPSPPKEFQHGKAK